MGDWTGAGSDTFFSGSDTTGEIRLSSVGVSSIGDQHGRTNGTYISIDDVNEIIRIQSEGHVVIGDDDWTGYGNDTHIQIDDVNQTISASATKFIVVDGAGSLQNANINANGEITTATSDYRLKKNINSISESVAIIKGLRGVTYNWKTKEEGNPQYAGDTDKTYYGLIAQEVTGSRAHSVSFEDRDGYLGVSLDQVVPVLIEAIKELEARVKELENK
jgi:hypothetical protein